MSNITIVPPRQFAFPRGWFMVAREDELSSSEPISLRLLGQKLVAYRDVSGRPVIMDSVCPHMGADIAVGGKLDQGGVRCPFHGWRFGPDGRCNEIPYNKAIPAKARVRAFPTRAVNGNVFIWHDPEEREPDYELPDLPGYHDAQWVKWRLERRDIRTTPHEIIDNIADRAHFPVVHGAGIAEFRNTFEGPRATQYALNLHETLAATKGGELVSRATYHGPGFLLTELSGHHPAWMLICHTPIDKEQVAVWYGTMVRSPGPINAESLRIAAEYVELGKVAFFQDVKIWENKNPAPNPLLVANDGPILQARAWYAQFFRPREAPRVEAAEQRRVNLDFLAPADGLSGDRQGRV
jgi:3-ketosteroid 9alpha-monooxygenase subunit A